MKKIRVKTENSKQDNKSQNKLQGHVVDTVLAAANFMALFLSVIYLINPLDGIVSNIFGIYIILILVCNLIASVFEKNNVFWNYTYILLTSVTMFAVPLLNTVASANPVNSSSRSIAAILLLLLEFLIGFSLPTARLFLKKKNTVKHADTTPKRIFRLVLIAVSILILCFGLYFCYDLLTRRSAGIFEVFVPEYALFFGLYFLSITALVVKLSRPGFKTVSVCAGVLGTVIFAICLVPIGSVPYLLGEAKQKYTKAFGNEVVSVTKDPSFKNMPFSVPEYLFGTVSGNYTVEENILFYQGIEGVDEGIKLHFDVYSPSADIMSLPGKGSVLIRLHGGAWNIGDKGASNYAQVNKYFASQGYVVFDVQYGLNNKNKFVKFATVPENVTGSFNMDDMVRHIGIFTTYLYDHKDEFAANTDSVFISGGSAGGQLTVATGLALKSQKYDDILDSRITIKGIIPFYPANGLARIGGGEELVNPTELVDENSPPCLIYQGTHDGIVNPQISTDLKNAYLANNNEKCALISMPLASHGSDIYFSGYYNQVFTYYMERFMMQYK